MNYIIGIFIVILIASCSNDPELEESLETTESILDEMDKIDEAMEKVNIVQTKEKRDTSRKSYFLALFNDKKDSVWMVFVASSESDILSKYPNLSCYKERPYSISETDYWKIRRVCSEEDLLFDIDAEPTGWLKENVNRLK